MADTRAPANDPVAEARARLADLLEKHPEAEAYTWPPSAGDVRAVAGKLDEISSELKKLNGLLERSLRIGGS